jgi:U3 small nucleolar RNA-associated protein 10
MVQDTDLARFVSSLLPSAHQGSYSHRALLAFNIGVMHEYIVRCKILDESIVGFVVSALVEALKGGSDGNVVVRNVPSLFSISSCYHLCSPLFCSLGAMFSSRLFRKNATLRPKPQRL